MREPPCTSCGRPATHRVLRHRVGSTNGLRPRHDGNRTMTNTEFYAALDGLVRQERGTITGREKLSDLGKWDSLAIVGFIALLDEQFGLIVPVTNILACQTVADLLALVPQDRFKSGGQPRGSE